LREARRFLRDFAKNALDTRLKAEKSASSAPEGKEYVNLF
jgi:hypothetical protein